MMPPVWDPHRETEAQATQAAIGVEAMRRAGIRVTIDAAGVPHDKPIHQVDPRLAHALVGHPRPATHEELIERLGEAGYTDPQEQRVLSMAYALVTGRNLPSEKVEATNRQYTLGSLGLRRQTKLTQREFAERLR